MVKMIAKKQFDGLEGFIEPGTEFEVEREDRAAALEALDIAEYAPAKKKKDKEAN